MRTLKEYHDFMTSVGPIKPATDDARLLRDYFEQDWDFVIESVFVSSANLLIVKGEIILSLLREEEKKKKKGEGEVEPAPLFHTERNWVDIRGSGVGIANLSVPFQEAVQRATRRARHHALGQLGFAVLPDEHEDVMPISWSRATTPPTSTNNVVTKTSPPAKPAPKKPAKAKSAEEEEETGDSCEDCGGEIQGFRSSKGNFISVSQLKSMTKKQYGVVLCSDCSKTRYAESRS